MADSFDLEAPGEPVVQPLLGALTEAAGSSLEECVGLRRGGQMGTKACGVRGKTQEAHMGSSLGSSNIDEEPGPGTFSGRLYQMYSTAEAPRPLPKPLGEMGAVTTMGFPRNLGNGRGRTRKWTEFLLH